MSTSSYGRKVFARLSDRLCSAFVFSIPVVLLLWSGFSWRDPSVTKDFSNSLIYSYCISALVLAVFFGVSSRFVKRIEPPLRSLTTQRSFSRAAFGCLVSDTLLLVVFLGTVGFRVVHGDWPSLGYWVVFIPIWLLAWSLLNELLPPPDDYAPVLKDEGFWRSLWQGQRIVKIDDPLSVTIDANGLPVVSWTTMESSYNFYRETHPEDRTRVISVFSQTAKISIENGHLVVERELSMRYISKNERDDPWHAKRVLFSAQDNALLNIEHTVMWTSPADDVQSFTEQQASVLELLTDDLAKFRIGKLLWDDHNIVQCNASGGAFGTLSRDNQNSRFTKGVIGVLSREFIIKRPPGGWARMCGLADAAVPTQQAAGASVSPPSAPATKPTAEHDPI